MSSYSKAYSYGFGGNVSSTRHEDHPGPLGRLALYLATDEVTSVLCCVGLARLLVNPPATPGYRP